MLQGGWSVHKMLHLTKAHLMDSDIGDAQSTYLPGLSFSPIFSEMATG